jgi:predicted ester cyclase
MTNENFDTNYVCHTGAGRDIRGLKETNQFNSTFYDALPDLHFTLDDLIVEGDKAVARYTATGTHKGVYRGIPPTNKKVTVWGIVIDRFVGGKFVESWSRMDTLSLMQQLGAVPTPKKEK